MRLEGVKEVAHDEATTLRAERPACAKFLRSNRKREYPKLRFLLAPNGAMLNPSSSRWAF